MGRKNSKAEAPIKPVNMQTALGVSRVETKRGKDYTIRKTFDGQSMYKCPGCNGSIASGTPSLTVIARDHIFGEQAAIDERRHWHEACWKSFR